MATNSSDAGIFDILSGDKAFQIEISLEPVTVSYLLGGAFLVGVILIIISKKLIK